MWVRVNAAGTYTLFLQNANQTQSYKQDFNIGTPNVWTQLTLPNIPAFPTGVGTWGTNPQDWSYTVGICLGAGTTFQSTSQSSWASANNIASASTTNFLATGTNTIDICLTQHEPGAICTTFHPDDSISATLQKCQRYALGCNALSLGYTLSSGVLNNGVLRNNWRVTPTLVPGGTYSVSSGNVGAVALGTATGSAATPACVTMINPSSNWTVSVAVAFTGILTAEL
jgi:hypothetical protein